MKVIFPPQTKWDFRDIKEPDLESAMLYEYTRTSTASEPIAALPQSKIRGKKVCKHILDSLIAKDKKQLAIAPYPPGVKSAIFSGLVRLFKNRVVGIKLARIIMEMRPDFPAPWTAFDSKLVRNDRFSNVRLMPHFPSPEHFGENAFILTVDFTNLQINQAVADFEKWFALTQIK
jgi:hypothetical protein